MSRPESATAVVTAADSGIGKTVALALARDGPDVGLTFHTDADGAADTAAQIRDLGRRAEVRPVDLTDLPGAADVVDDLAEALGLCRDEPSYVTGASCVVDGGMLATAAMGASELPDDSWRS